MVPSASHAPRGIGGRAILSGGVPVQLSLLEQEIAELLDKFETLLKEIEREAEGAGPGREETGNRE